MQQGQEQAAALGELDLAHHLTEEVCMRSFFRGLQMVDVHKRLVEPYAELADLWYNPSRSVEVISLRCGLPWKRRIKN